MCFLPCQGGTSGSADVSLQRVGSTLEDKAGPVEFLDPSLIFLCNCGQRLCFVGS